MSGIFVIASTPIIPSARAACHRTRGSGSFISSESGSIAPFACECKDARSSIALTLEVSSFALRSDSIKAFGSIASTASSSAPRLGPLNKRTLAVTNAKPKKTVLFSDVKNCIMILFPMSYLVSICYLLYTRKSSYNRSLNQPSKQDRTSQK